MLDAWRGQGADRVDPVRFRFIEALARRAGAQEGEARRILDARLASLLQAYAAEAERAAQAGDETARESAANAAGAGAVPEPAAGQGLAGLAASLAVRGGPCGPAGDDMAILDYFRGLWAELRVGRELRQALNNVPENAGPLNSLHLVHQSLMLMHDLAPGYLRHFLSYADTLSWLERMSGADLLPVREQPARPQAPKKGGSGRRQP